MTIALATRKASKLDSPHNLDLAVADAVWIGVALLHRKYSNRAQFSIDEIVDSVVTNRLTDKPRTTVRQHVVQHCVANRKAQPNRSCMLYATREEGDSGDTHRRIFRDCDVARVHPDRRGAPTHPNWEKLPKQYADLRDWYEMEREKSSPKLEDPLLALAGTGKGMFGDQGADAYVNALRAGWDDRA